MTCRSTARDWTSGPETKRTRSEPLIQVVEREILTRARRTLAPRTLRTPLHPSHPLAPLAPLALCASPRAKPIDSVHASTPNLERLPQGQPGEHSGQGVPGHRVGGHDLVQPAPRRVPDAHPA